MEIKHYIQTFVWGVLLILEVFYSTARAQENEGGTPPSFYTTNLQRAKISIPTYTTSAIPFARLQAEDAILDQGKFPFRFGYNFDVSLDLKKEGVMQTLSDGSRLWTFRVSCPNAISINFLYSKFHLPLGAQLFIYNSDASFILGAYTKKNNQATEKFGTETVPGDLVTLEYIEPANPEFDGSIVIGVITHGYRTHDSDPQVQAAGSCNVNINCPEAAGWENQKRAVARIIMNGNTLCTGTLINNARRDDTPYFITADHCIGDLDAVSKPDASGWVFYWNYESATCSGTSGPQTQTTAGAIVRANNDLSDVALMELKSKPAASYNVYYAGWNRSTIASVGAVGIHHPAGDIKKFSKDNSTLENSNGTHWRVPSWDIGVTEGGSSGSAIFDLNKRFIGQLTGGASGCGVPTANLWDVYGKLSYSWDQGGTTPQRRLKDWLDPDNTGAIVLDGKNPGTVSNNPPSVTITSPLDNSGLPTPANITITAAANDTDGNITKVEFFNGTTKLGEDNTSPYSFTWTNVAIGNYSITAKATDNGGATGTSAPVVVNVFNYRNPENPASTVAGVEYSYYEGSWTELPNFNSLTPIKTGTIASFDITPANVDDNFGFQFTGYINIPTDGYYTFYTTSDDGSQLFIGSTLVVDNNGLHGSQERQGSIGLKAGKHAIRAIFFERGGDQVFTASYSSSNIAKQVIPATSLFRIGTIINTPPTISIISPINNSTYTLPTNITITANAIDSDGTITKVEFYNGTTLLGTDITVPYSFVWTNATAGSYSLSAKVTDNNDATTTSSVITIQINNPANQAPTVSISSPLNNASFVSPANVTINATANDSDGSITKVEFYSGTTLLGTDATAPYSFIWTNLASGSYSLSAKATDNNNATTTSSVVTIQVTNPVNQVPVVSISSPTNNSSFVSPASITINANASDADGQISKVEFFNGTTKLGEDNTSPYSYTWTGVTVGSYSISAKATDNTGATTTSGIVTITVTPPADNCSNIIAYAYGTTYSAGNKVKNEGRIYECKPWPYSGWCSGAAWAYAPGTGMYWADAWIDAGSCNKAKTTGLNNTTELTLKVIPNPTENYVTINIGNIKEFDIQLFDAMGNKVTSQKMTSESQLDLSQLPTGIYVIQTIIEDSIVTNRIVKK